MYAVPPCMSLPCPHLPGSVHIFGQKLPLVTHLLADFYCCRSAIYTITSGKGLEPPLKIKCEPGNLNPIC